MSASEKLKALADDPHAERWRVVRAEDGENTITADPVYAALPQIVAVTSAAEILSGQTFGALDSRAFYALREALAALDKALS